MADRLKGKDALEVTVERPGLHRVSFAGSDGVVRPLSRESFVANINPRESDLRLRHDPSLLEGPEPPTVLAMRKVELWHGLGALLLVVLLLEAALLRKA